MVTKSNFIRLLGSRINARSQFFDSVKKCLVRSVMELETRALNCAFKRLFFFIKLFLLVAACIRLFKFIYAMSVLQPGPRESPVQCFIRRNRSTQTFHLYLGLNHGTSHLCPFIYSHKLSVNIVPNASFF